MQSLKPGGEGLSELSGLRSTQSGEGADAGTDNNMRQQMKGLRCAQVTMQAQRRHSGEGNNGGGLSRGVL